MVKNLKRFVENVIYLFLERITDNDLKLKVDESYMSFASVALRCFFNVTNYRKVEKLTFFTMFDVTVNNFVKNKIK